MKICIAQIKSKKGDIKANIENHLIWIQVAIAEKADLIVFPELSLTSYEPELAKELVTDQNDQRLNQFQKLSDLNQIVIGIGLPTKSEAGICISMVIISPYAAKLTYSKQLLHNDELPYFTQGTEQIILNVKNNKIAPAICYETLQPEHSKNANALGAEIYLASVAKSASGIENAYAYFPHLAKEYSMPVLMVNSIGFCDNFQSAGQSAVWDSNGVLKGKLDSDKEDLLIFDTETNEVIKQENINQIEY